MLVVAITFALFAVVLAWFTTSNVRAVRVPEPVQHKTPIDYPLGDIDELVRWAEQRGINQFNEERQKLTGPDLPPGNPVVKIAAKPLTQSEMHTFDILENELRCVDTDLQAWMRVERNSIGSVRAAEMVTMLRDKRLKIHNELTGLLAGK